MKKLPIILGVCALALMMATTCLASPYKGPVLLVEADPTGPPGDGEIKVTFTVSFFDPLWTVGEYIGGSFDQFIDEDSNTDGIQVIKNGGTIVDFAVSDGCTILCLSDNIHEVTFLQLNSGVPEVPNWVTKWYDDLYITWLGGPVPGMQLVTTDGDPDGLAPIPVPSTLLLLGSGLIGFVGLRRKFNKG